MTREEKIEAIYKEMANKEMSFWCFAKTNEDKTEMICSKLTNDWTSFSTIPYPDGRRCWFTTIYNLRNSEWINLDSKRTIKEIIWHPVMIGTIFERYSSSRWFINSQFITKLIDKWTWYDESIDEQSDECIDYVYSLIKK